MSRSAFRAFRLNDPLKEPEDFPVQRSVVSFGGVDETGVKVVRNTQVYVLHGPIVGLEWDHAEFSLLPDGTYAVLRDRNDRDKVRGNFTNHRTNPRVSVTCPCGNTFQVSQQRIDAGRGRRCSRACKLKFATRPSGLTYRLKVENPTSFRKGDEPWNKGSKGAMPEPWNKGLKGIHISPSTEFKPGNVPASWKGADVGYSALHAWLRRAYGNPSACQHCGVMDRIQWANRTGLYLRERGDWLHLCALCHRRYDIENGLIGIVAGRFA